MVYQEYEEIKPAKRPTSGWYAWTVKDNHVLVFGWYKSEEEAYADLRPKLRDFEVIELQTIDKREATRKIKKMVFDRTENLELALQRAKHQI